MKISSGRIFIHPVIVALMLVAVFRVSASVTFVDIFDTDGASTDVNYQLTNRQSGQVWPVDWGLGAGVTPDEIQVNTGDAPGRLRVDAVNGEGMYSGVLAATYLEHNFIESTNFAIDFDMTLAVDSGTSWAGIVIGASTAPISVNLSDGVGLLFNRNDNQIQLFDQTVAAGSKSAVAAGFPGGFGFNSGIHVRIEVAMSGAYGGAGTTTIKLFINGIQAILPKGTGAGEYDRASTFAANNITLMGVAFNTGENFVDTYDNFQITDLTNPGEYLQITPAGTNNVILSWPASATGYSLQTNNVISGGTWGDTGLSPTVAGANNQIPFDTSHMRRFFRLAQ